MSHLPEQGGRSASSSSSSCSYVGIITPRPLLRIPQTNCCGPLNRQYPPPWIDISKDSNPHSDHVHLQVQLYSVAHPVVLQRKLILEWSLSLPLQHDLMGFPPNSCRNLGLE